MRLFISLEIISRKISKNCRTSVIYDCGYNQSSNSVNVITSRDLSTVDTFVEVILTEISFKTSFGPRYLNMFSTFVPG